ncbi:hypothetical protein SNE40_005908 [Patella caerulea]|uniref:Mutator-like transposase domain-containing protein n=1 Tax=Patella caerulea TaxID=87958 RepID=A0AAN8K6D1_PATCE
MPVGNTRARSGVQTLSNQVSAKMRRLNTVNMREKIEAVKFFNVTVEAVNPNIINVAVDGRYNSITIGHSKMLGQAALQAIGIACETNTKHKYILSAVMQHKLCWLRGKGVTVNCPGGHEGCTASLPVYAPLS